MFPVVPEHIYNVPYAQALEIVPVGNGAFKFESMDVFKSISLVANSAYFKGAPVIEFVEIIFTPDDTATLSAFEQGIVDLVYTDVMDFSKYTRDKTSVIYEIPTQKYEFIGINFNVEALQDGNVSLLAFLSQSTETINGVTR